MQAGSNGLSIHWFQVPMMYLQIRKCAGMGQIACYRHEGIPWSSHLRYWYHRTVMGWRAIWNILVGTNIMAMAIMNYHEVWRVLHQCHDFSSIPKPILEIHVDKVLSSVVWQFPFSCWWLSWLFPVSCDKERLQALGDYTQTAKWNTEPQSSRCAAWRKRQRTWAHLAMKDALFCCNNTRTEWTMLVHDASSMLMLDTTMSFLMTYDLEVSSTPQILYIRALTSHKSAIMSPRKVWSILIQRATEWLNVQEVSRAAIMVVSKPQSSISLTSLK